MTPRAARRRSGRRLLAAALLALLAPTALAQEVTYFPPGDVLPAQVSGIESRKVALPDWRFPLEVGPQTGRHAFIGTQLSAYHGLPWANDPRLFAYPHRDNQCEPRRWKVARCPSGKGHQGNDIRAHDNRDNTWPVVAVEDGIVTRVSGDTIVFVKSGTRTVRYMHMHPASISEAGIRAGVRVTAGQRLGRVSCFMGGKCQTSQHLHLDAYDGVAGAGNFYHVYPSLIAAYRRAWGLDAGVVAGELRPDPAHEVRTGTRRPPAPGGSVPAGEQCADVTLAGTPGLVDPSRAADLWMHNCSVMARIENGAAGTFSFAYLRPKSSVADAIEVDPVLFTGTVAGASVNGTAKVYSSRCGPADFTVSGSTAEEADGPVMRLSGREPRRDAGCNRTGEREVTLVFTFAGRTDPPVVAPDHQAPGDRTTLSEITRNFLAITFYPDGGGRIELLPYFSAFPGLSAERGLLDKKGGLIPRLLTDEAGVAISWVWIRKRARFTDGLTLTPRGVAHSMAGVDPSACGRTLDPTPAASAAMGETTARERCGAVAAYLRGYVGFANGRGFASDYFGRVVGLDETLNLALPDVAWNWMRTMYSHESGRAPVVDRRIFERGLRLGDDYIREFYDNESGVVRPIAFYADPCNFGQPGCAGGGGAPLEPAPVPGEGGGADPVLAELARVTAELRVLRDEIAALEARLDRAGSALGGLAADGGGN